MANGPDCAVLLEAATAAGVAGQPESASHRRRSFLRFRVRGLLLLILAIGCGLGWIAHVVRTGQTQRSAVAAIYQAGGWVLYDTDWDEGQATTSWKPRWPRSLVDRLGVDYFGNVVFINLHDRGTDAVMAQVGLFTHLKQLHRPGLAVTDAGLAHLRRLNELELLSLNSTQVTDAGLAHLKGLKGLKWLRVVGTRITDAGLRALQMSLPQLQAIR
jgi:internalin A